MFVFLESPCCSQKKYGSKQMPLQLKRSSRGYAKQVSQCYVHYNDDDQHQREPGNHFPNGGIDFIYPLHPTKIMKEAKSSVYLCRNEGHQERIVGKSDRLV